MSRMMGRAVVAGLVVLLVLSSARAQEPPAAAKLVKEKRLLDADRLAYEGPGGAALDPQGRYLLCALEPEEARGCRFVLRDLTTNEDKNLPIPLADDGDMARIFLGLGEPFGPASDLLLLPTGDDADNDGVLGLGEEKMDAALYAIASGELRRLNVNAVFVIGTFDHAGRQVFIAAGDGPAAIELSATPIMDIALKRLGIKALALRSCPTEPVLPVLEIVGAGEGQPQFKVHLLDARDGKAIREIPLPKEFAQDGPPAAHWTPDGRFLCFSDGNDGEGVTRIWDRKEDKEVRALKGCVPVGPGPGPSLVVLMRTELLEETAEGRTERLTVLVHDASEGKDIAITAPIQTALCARGSRLVYVRPGDGPDDKPGVYIADIVMPE